MLSLHSSRRMLRVTWNPALVFQAPNHRIIFKHIHPQVVDVIIPTLWYPYYTASLLSAVSQHPQTSLLFLYTHPSPKPVILNPECFPNTLNPSNHRPPPEEHPNPRKSFAVQATVKH